MITIDDKKKIAARVFFTDCREDYEDYREALAEFASGLNASDKFVEACVEPYLHPKDGHLVFVSSDGHVAEVRESDGFFSPRTTMTQEEGETMEERFQKICAEFPDLDEIECFMKIGWKKAST